MKAWILATLLWAAAALPGAAQMQFSDMHVFETRHGTLSVVGGEVDNFIHFGGQTYDTLYGAQVLILGGIGQADQAPDWVLIWRFTGGNGCFAPFTILQVRPGALVASPEFGHCAAEPMDMRIAGEAVEVVLSHPDAAIAEERFFFDGQMLETRQGVVALPDTAAGAGADVTRWLGQHPHAVFDDLSERARFATVMPENEISALANHVSVADVTIERGGWIIGQGCLPHQCDVSRGLWAIRVSDGAVGAAILGGNGYVAWFGLAETDPTLRAAVEALRP